ncbi:type I-E CRISPR-associated protein Cas5/CasD [Streptomyces sp. NPDC008125]|uniref:type I-E CRISPR-associated protein Cas5/CasD n=1 Tax=Streptomyces sp. NPDC008125 TaxID=3364811 RepID=UPI0036E87C8F
MSSVLTLRLAGPLQAWGSSARFTRRTTESAPTKSGVVGLLASALGRPRRSDLSDLAALRFGVRIDQPGARVRDFQTAHHPETGKSMPVSERFYLSDAVFVAAVEGDAELLVRLRDAVRAPVFLPFLGRRSCPPSGPIDLGLHEDVEVSEALAAETWQASDWYQRQRSEEETVELTALLEGVPGDGPAEGSLRDQPVSFDPAHRRYALRSVVSEPVRVRNPRHRPDRRPARTRRPVTPPAHDPTAALTSAVDEGTPGGRAVPQAMADAATVDPASADPASGDRSPGEQEQPGTEGF